MAAAPWRPQRARTPESASCSTTCETLAVRSRRPLPRGATDEEAPKTPGPARCARRRRLRRAELPTKACDRAGERPDRLRRRLDALAGLQHHRGPGVHRHSTQDRRDRTLGSAKTKTETLTSEGEAG